MLLPPEARELGIAPSPETLARGLREGEVAIRFPGGSCNIWAVPVGWAAEQPELAGCLTAPEVVHPFGVPAALQERFREIVQDWKGQEIVDAFAAQGGKWNRELTTGEMALLILGPDKQEELQDGNRSIAGAITAGSDCGNAGKPALGSGKSGEGAGRVSTEAWASRGRGGCIERRGTERGVVGAKTPVRVQGSLFD